MNEFTLYDLLKFKSTELNDLLIALDFTINECGDSPKMESLKKRMEGWRLIIEGASSEVIAREVREEIKAEEKLNTGLAKHGLNSINCNWN